MADGHQTKEKMYFVCFHLHSKSWELWEIYSVKCDIEILEHKKVKRLSFPRILG